MKNPWPALTVVAYFAILFAIYQGTRSIGYVKGRTLMLSLVATFLTLNAIAEKPRP